MTFLFRGLLCWALGTGALEAASVVGASAEISYEGRTVVESDGSARLGYAGTVVRVEWTGTSLDLRARTTSEELFLDVAVDGAAPDFLHVPRGESKVSLARALPVGRHRVVVTKRVESSVGILEVLGFDTDGQFLPAPALPERRLLFLGDSFTSGQATTVEDGGPMHPSKAMRQNARLAYGRLLAERLGAQAHLVACAGKGVLRDWQGLRSVRLAPDYYENALPDDESTRWNPARYVPDAICVCLGNNDFGEGVPDQTEFVQRYSEFVRKLRRDAPGAFIFLVTSPSLTDGPNRVPMRSVQKAYFDEIARRLADPRVAVVQIGSYPGVPGDWHPSGTAHRAVAKELEPVLRAALQWP